ncbi:sigma-70 family RNA polymerase sigma factor [Promicromonospora sukumoe]|uniref:RNA polymerase sigma-70 factor (ECF subfamily) n=1 Tax=Promicromonospora sukumoe TaxID=88382 RepID=A0A7W3JEL7_9MICO|nr:sigma-70 family RNA polymerase sigma factor [Promicromonospora sukumoe]MBA8811396.1 RNA polymerase sigma-70 factor (ECF subfamily) [Promicromonospora sukumoe]
MTPDELALAFEQHRPRLRAVAYRMLGNPDDADDALQEAWLRLNRTGDEGIDNLAGWLTTVTGRICLDMLRSRSTRREDPLPSGRPDDTAPEILDDASPDPVREAELADVVGVAMQVVLESLDPAERLAFMLHDLFAVPYEQIAPVLGRSVVAARQLASRGRRRVQSGPAARAAAGADAGADVGPRADVRNRTDRQVVEAFLLASRTGDLAGLLAVLAPDVVLRADQAALAAAAEAADRGAPLLAREVRGAAAVAQAFRGRAGGAVPALIDGSIGFAYAPDGTPRGLFAVVVHDGHIAAVDMMGDPATVAGAHVLLLG